MADADPLELTLAPEVRSAAPAEISIRWTDGLEVHLRKLLREHRTAPHEPNVSTPEMLGRAIRKEKEIEDTTMRKLLLALSRHQSSAVDCDILAAMDRLKALLRHTSE